MKHILTLILLIIGGSAFSQTTYTPLVGTIQIKNVTGGKRVILKSNTGDTTTLVTPVVMSQSTVTKDYVDILNAQVTFQTFVASGNGSLTTISFTHGRSGFSSLSNVIVTPRNADSAGILYADIDATNIYIYYSVAPPAGTNNLKYSITIKP